MQDQLNIPTRLLENYKKLDLNEQDVIVIVHIINFQKQNQFLPSFDQIAEHMTINENEVANILKKLRNKGYLLIDQVTGENDLVHEWYSITPLFEILYEVDSTKKDDIKEEGKIFGLFEQEFGRALSPIEIETISYWLDDDNFKPALIKAALREAVLMGKLNFRYIDRILADWKKKGIKSVHDTKKETKHYVKNEQHQETKKRDTSVYYNWLEE